MAGSGQRQERSGGPGRRPTIRDVAAVAGVSNATVSRYVNSTTPVSTQTAAAIEDAIRSVRYVPNQTARSLVRRRSQAVAFVVRETHDHFFADPNLSQMAAAASEVLTRAGYLMMILLVDSDPAADQMVQLVNGGFVDGAIMVAVREEDPVPLRLAEAGSPVVTASRPLPGSDVPWVDCDNTGGSETVTRVLMAAGYRLLAEIRGPDREPAASLRHLGFRRAMGERYREDLVLSAPDWTVEAGRSTLHRLLAREPGVDAVVAASDSLAAGAVEALREVGRTVPEEFGVVGFDDSVWARTTLPSLTTVAQDAPATGRAMAEVLLRQIAGEDMSGHGHLLDTRLVRRASTR